MGNIHADMANEICSGLYALCSTLPIADISINDLIRLALLSQLASSFDKGFRPIFFQIVI